MGDHTPKRHEIRGCSCSSGGTVCAHPRAPACLGARLCNRSGLERVVALAGARLSFANQLRHQVAVLHKQGV